MEELMLLKSKQKADAGRLFGIWLDGQSRNQVVKSNLELQATKTVFAGG
jgi:hypothetical protein